MELNILRQLDRDQLLKVIKESGYNDIAKILSKQNVNGQSFVNIHEIQILNWQCTPMMTKKMINFIKEFRENPSIIQLSSLHSTPREFNPASKSPSGLLPPSLMKRLLPRSPEPKISKIPDNISININERRASLPSQNDDYPIKKGVYLPLPGINRQNKSLNDLNNDQNDTGYNYVNDNNEMERNTKRFEVNAGTGSTSPLINISTSIQNVKGKQYPGKNIQNSFSKSSINKPPMQIPQNYDKSTSSVPKIGLHKSSSSSEFSSDEEEFVSYVSKIKVADDPDPIYGNIETSTSTLNPKMTTNILPNSFKEELKSKLKQGYGIENRTGNVQKPLNTVYSTRKTKTTTNPNSNPILESSHYDYPPMRIFNQSMHNMHILPLLSTIELERQKSSIVNNSYRQNEFGKSADKKVYSNEPIYENIDDIFLRDKNLDDLIVRHRDKEISNDYEYDEAYSYRLSTPNDSDSLPTYSNEYEFEESPIKTLSYNNVTSSDDNDIYMNIGMLKQTEKEEITMNLNAERFYRNTDRKGARLLLRDLPDRAFLFRPSHRYYLVLTVKCNDNFFNLGIKQTPDKKLSLDSDADGFSIEFDSLTEFVNYFTQTEIAFMAEGEYLQIRLNPVLPADLF